MALLEGVMQMPEDAAVIRQLLEKGWSQRCIARELGISRHTVSRYRNLDDWQPYDSRRRSGQLDEHPSVCNSSLSSTTAMPRWCGKS